MTDLNALTESCSIEARKLPAAPALLGELVQRLCTVGRVVCEWTSIHDIVDATELLDTALGGALQVVEVSNINGANANDLGPRAACGNILSDALCLLDIATDDTRICSEVNQSANLGTADCASTTCAEDDLVGCKEESVNESTDMAEGEAYRRCPPSRCR
jgi:hypothetical protein